MSRYLNIKNNAIIKVTAQDDVRKTVEVEYEEDGRTTNLSMSTLKRWWRKIEDDEPVKEEKSTPVKETSKSDKEKSEKAKADMEAIKAAVVEQKAKKASTVKKAPKPKKENPAVPEILEFIDKTSEKAGMNFYVRDKQPNLKQYRFDEGKVRFMVRVLRQRVEIHCKSRDIQNEALSKMKTMGGFFNKKYDIEELTSDSKQVITDIIKNYKKEDK